MYTPEVASSPKEKKHEQFEGGNKYDEILKAFRAAAEEGDWEKVLEVVS